MSWGLEIFTRRESQIAQQELVARLADIAPQLDILPQKIGGGSACDWTSLLLVNRGDNSGLQASVSLLDFRSECDADPKLFPVLEKEIAATDADVIDIDKEYRRHLMSLLRAARKHYIVTTTQSDCPEQERTVVQITYALSQIAGGLVHDLQSGAWMDPDLFEGLLDAYGAAGRP